VSGGRRSSVRHLRMACLGLLASALALSACSEVDSNLVETQPYKVEPIKGTDLQRVTLDDSTAARIDLQTAKVRGDRKRKVVPHLALIYNPEGDAFVYTRPEPQTYVRARVKVRRADGDRVALSDGPPAGTDVVTVGAAELLATEYEILNQHP
jgi:hypothetical protein